MNPDELLQQIRAMLDQYLALGGDTPVAPEAQALAQAIDGASGAGGEAPPEAMGGDMGGGMEMPPEEAMGGAVPDLSGMMPDQMPTSSGSRSPFRDASNMALEDIKKRSKGGR